MSRSTLFGWFRGDARPVTRDGRELGISTLQAARLAAALFIIGAAVDLFTALQPSVSGLDKRLTIVVSLCCALAGVIIWRLPWQRWSRRSTLWLVPVALACVGLSNVAGGQNPWAWSLFFLVLFVWVGMCHPSGWSLRVLPLFVVAYLLPLYPTHQTSPMALSSVVYVGIVCVVVGESAAWVSARWHLAESELSTLMGNLPGMAYQCANDRQWTMAFVSAGCRALTGYEPEALIGNAVVAFADLVDPDDADRLMHEVEVAIDSDAPWTCIYRITTASGDVRWVWERGVAVKVGDGDVRVLEGFIQDVTEQHRLDKKLTAAAAEWRQTFDAMQDSVCVLDASGVVLRSNRAGSRLAGVDVSDMVGAYCYEVFHGAGDFIGECALQRARKSGRTESAIRRQDGHWLRESFQPVRDGEGSFAGGIHVVSDISELKQTEERLSESLSRVQAMSEEVIAAIAAIVEVRDPYTAGHQRRVSHLSAAIAAELGLDGDAVAGVKVAGMMHDVGKAIVPAEILSKPGRLSEHEFELIKGHAEAGYEVLRSIEFPWPVAEVTRQHHERLDGSGYPRGLAGDAIILEARILAVADVVEAMASHRPYRPALGLEAALSEIEGGRGRLYDALVVDACVRVFADGTFSLEERPATASVSAE